MHTNNNLIAASTKFKKRQIVSLRGLQPFLISGLTHQHTQIKRHTHTLSLTHTHTHRGSGMPKKIPSSKQTNKHRKWPVREHAKKRRYSKESFQSLTYKPTYSKIARRYKITFFFLVIVRSSLLRDDWYFWSSV